MSERCPKCETFGVREPGTAEASDGVLETTHRCPDKKCNTKWRHVEGQFNHIRIRADKEAVHG